MLPLASFHMWWIPTNSSRAVPLLARWNPMDFTWQRQMRKRSWGGSFHHHSFFFCSRPFLLIILILHRFCWWVLNSHTSCHHHIHKWNLPKIPRSFALNFFGPSGWSYRLPIMRKFVWEIYMSMIVIWPWSLHHSHFQVFTRSWPLPAAHLFISSNSPLFNPFPVPL